MIVTRVFVVNIYEAQSVLCHSLSNHC